MGSKRCSCDKASCSMCQVFMFQEIFIPLTVSVLPLGFVSRDIYTLAVVVSSQSEAGLITDFPLCTFPVSTKLTADLSSLMLHVDLHNVDSDGWNKEVCVGTYWKIANAVSSILQAHATKRKVVDVVWGGQHNVCNEESISQLECWSTELMSVQRDRETETVFVWNCTP